MLRRRNLTSDQRRVLVIPLSLMTILLVGAIYSASQPKAKPFSTPR